MAAFSYKGKLGELYKIFLLNLFLGIITLGIYHFWGKTRMRRYLAAHFFLGNDPFEYTGLGKELFWGFIKTVVLLFLIAIPFLLASQYAEKSLEEAEALRSQQASVSSSQNASKYEELEKAESDLRRSYEEVLYFIITTSLFSAYSVFYFIYLPFVAVFASLRYQASRLRWRGIRGALSERGFIYGLVGLLHTFLRIITLGFWTPCADIMTYQYKIKRLSLGTQAFTFTPRYGKLFFVYILILIIALSIGISIGVLTYFFTEDFSYPIGIGAVSFVLVYFFLRYWYQAALIQARYEGCHLASLGFQCDMTGWRLFKLNVLNLLILFFTLGLGIPIVIHRRLRFFCQYVIPLGDLEQMRFLQSPATLDKTGEGLSSFLDINIGLF